MEAEMEKMRSIHQTITDSIIAAIENGAAKLWQMPWHQGAAIARPANVETGRRYSGINIVALWAASQNLGFSSGTWGTFRQWKNAGATVRKGAKASYVVFNKSIAVDDGEEADTEASDDQNASRRCFIAKATPVFNADQIDGWSESAPEIKTPAEIDERAEAIVAATNARIEYGGDRACYIPTNDLIRMPQRTAFTGTETSSSTESYYSTLFHELTHWTAPAHRCDRDLSGRFGSNSYAVEELVAELGAAFLCAEIGISATPRADHADYIASWLKCLKADNRAVFKAAAQASRAAEFVQSMSAS
jgi:antirestriction protein ArdC